MSRDQIFSELVWYRSKHAFETTIIMLINSIKVCSW